MRKDTIALVELVLRRVLLGLLDALDEKQQGDAVWIDNLSNMLTLEGVEMRN